MGDKETETTNYYKDGKKHSILYITRLKPLLNNDACKKEK